MFITFEGIEGCGKSTQIKRLQSWFEKQGQNVLSTLEPGGSRIGKELRRLLLTMESTDLSGEAELFLYLADRAQHVANIICPALEQGKIVLSDRFADSTVAYQGYGRGLDPKLLHTLNQVAIGEHWPQLTLLLDLNPEIGIKRAVQRNSQDGRSVDEGRFEAEAMSFHQKVREGFLSLATLHKDRIVIVDASCNPDKVFEQVHNAVQKRMSLTP